MQCGSPKSHSGNKDSVEELNFRATRSFCQLIDQKKNKQPTLHLFCMSCWIISMSPWQQGVWWWKEFCEIPHNSMYCAHTHGVVLFSKRHLSLDPHSSSPALPLPLVELPTLCVSLSRQKGLWLSRIKLTVNRRTPTHAAHRETCSLERTPLNGPTPTGKSVPLRKCKRSWRRRLQHRRDACLKKANWRNATKTRFHLTYKLP